VRQLEVWRRAGLDLSVSINVSARHFDVRRELERVALEVDGIPADRLVIEITEGSVMADVDGATEILRTLRDQGFGLSMDDFGTGFSSLSRLKDLPLTELKIDRSFVAQMVEDPNADAIVRSTIELGRNLGLHVVAEGVETTDQWDRLADLGCEAVQGFLLSRALPPSELEAWVGAWVAARKAPEATRSDIGRVRV